jgi:hypothetical protein
MLAGLYTKSEWNIEGVIEAKKLVMAQQQQQ